MACLAQSILGQEENKESVNTSSVHWPVLMLIWARWGPLAEESVWERVSNRGRMQRWSSLQQREGLAGSPGC